MRELKDSLPEVHVFVCTNDRPAPKTACNTFGGMDFYMRLKNQLKETKLNSRCWATRTGCLGFCNAVGTTVVVYSKSGETKCFDEVTQEDFDKIWDYATKELH